MKVYVVTYDLMKQGQNYTGLIARIQQYKSLKILLSTWLVRTLADAATVRNELSQHVDSNDRLFVATLTGEAAWQALMADNQSVKDFLNGK